MKKIINYIIISIAITGLFSCNFIKNEELNLNEQLKALNDNFLEIIGTNFYKVPIFDSGVVYLREDSLKLIVLLNNKFLSLKQIDSELDKLNTSSFFLRNRIDTAYYSLYVNLFKDTASSKNFSLNSISNNGRYNLKSQIDTVSLNEPFRFVGKMQFSKASFDKELTKCCFYYDFTDKNNQSFGYFIFMKKENRKWHIVSSFCAQST